MSKIIKWIRYFRDYSIDIVNLLSEFLKIIFIRYLLTLSLQVISDTLIHDRYSSKFLKVFTNRCNDPFLSKNIPTTHCSSICISLLEPDVEAGTYCFSFSTKQFYYHNINKIYHNSVFIILYYFIPISLFFNFLPELNLNFKHMHKIFLRKKFFLYLFIDIL